MNFEVTILGINSAMPTPNRNPSGQVVRVQDQFYLIDCGEGTQIRLTQYGIKRSKINQIFITHLHGDHFFGLFGLLTTMALSGRTTAVEVFSPKGLSEVFEVTMRHSGSQVPFPIYFREVEASNPGKVFEDNLIEVFTLPLIHRIPTVGYFIKEKKRPRKIIPEKIDDYQIPYQQIDAIKKGQHFITSDGKTIPNSTLTIDSPPPRSFAYCSDTQYNNAIPPLITGVDLLYHEATFCEDRKDRTVATGHSTAKEAAEVARLAKAKTLILGHFSTRYQDLGCFLKEAGEIFPNTYIGEEGSTYNIPITS